MIDFSFLKIRDGSLLGTRGYGTLRARSPPWGNEVAVPDDNFMDNPLHSVAFWRELSLLDSALDENVVALVEGHGDAGKIAVEREVVPVGVLLRFAVRALVSIALAQADVGDGSSGRKKSSGRLGSQIADDFETVSLHLLLHPSDGRFGQFMLPRVRGHRMVPGRPDGSVKSCHRWRRWPVTPHI
jgi:hypothetical protein